MRRISGAALLVLTASIAAYAQAPVRPIVRASLDPPRAVTIGEPVSLVVEILVPTFFMDAPSLPALELTNATATLGDGSDHTNATIDGAEWAGIRRKYRIVAQAPGTIHVPPADVVVRYAIDGRLSDPFTVPTPAL